MKYSVIFTALSVAGLASAFVENPYEDNLDLYSRDVYDSEFDAPFSLYERDLDADYEEPHMLYARALGRSSSVSARPAARPAAPQRSNSMPHLGSSGHSGAASPGGRHPTSEMASLYGGSSASGSRRSSFGSVGSAAGHPGESNKPTTGQRLMAGAKAYHAYATDGQNRHDAIDKGSKLGAAAFQTAGQFAGSAAGGAGGIASGISSGYGFGNLVNAANSLHGAVKKDAHKKFWGRDLESVEYPMEAQFYARALYDEDLELLARDIEDYYNALYYDF